MALPGNRALIDSFLATHLGHSLEVFSFCMKRNCVAGCSQVLGFTLQTMCNMLLK